MNRLNRRIFTRHPLIRVIPLTAALLFAISPRPAAAGGAMTLRLNDIEGAPGERVAVVLRTYAPREVEQGQICFRILSQDAGLAAGPFASLEQAVTFSSQSDTLSSAVFDQANQMVLLEFSSPSGTLNANDGPLAVLYFRLHESLSAAQTFSLEIDLDQTFVIPTDGESIVLRPKTGMLRVRSSDAPRRLETVGDTVMPGAVAQLSVITREPFAVSGGQVALSYNPALAAGSPAIRMDQRHGQAIFAVDATVPGRLLVSFESTDASLNRVPGKLVTIFLPLSQTAPAGITSALVLDPESSFLEDERGDLIELEMVAGVLQISGDEAE